MNRYKTLIVGVIAGLASTPALGQFSAMLAGRLSRKKWSWILFALPSLTRFVPSWTDALDGSSGMENPLEIVR